MTRPIGLLLVLCTLTSACLTGCTQLAWQQHNREHIFANNTFRPPRVESPARTGFSTSTEDRPQLESGPKKSTPPTLENEQPKKDLYSTLPTPPRNEPAAAATAVRTVEVKTASKDDAPARLTTSTEASSKKIAPKEMTSTPPGTALVEIPPLPGGDPIGHVTPASGVMRREPLVEALQCILEDRHTDVPDLLKKYDAVTQELFLRILPPLAMLTRKTLKELSTPEIASLGVQLNAVTNLLRPRTELTIDKACFCQWVKSFGNYKPLPEEHLFAPSAPARPGERVQLYAEVKNFISDNRDGLFETRFSSSVEIHDSKGEKIWHYRFDDRNYPIRSRTFLTDYFNNYSFFVPHLPAGNYTLTITIADETVPECRREARKTLDFRVGSALR